LEPGSMPSRNSRAHAKKIAELTRLLSLSEKAIHFDSQSTDDIRNDRRSCSRTLISRRLCDLLSHAAAGSRILLCGISSKSCGSARRASTALRGSTAPCSWALSSLPSHFDAMSIVRPETVVRWNRQGFTGYWREIPLAWWPNRIDGGARPDPRNEL